MAALLLLALGGAATAAPGGPRGERTPERLYAVTCRYCHGHNVGPVIRGRGIPPEMVRMIVRGGRNAMPAFRPTEISDAELDRLGRWIAASRADPREHGQ